ncbi:sensor histidine kinase [Acanthopleuribacter pedis]|uniref:histidine kinase n=1 Tax=Acanthopleuribacter pedis TaxID=442870 RepID=A0A8J7Q4Z0_9BACT|nr:HAMP domain-containing sensor histidine kinase [Acanthopleuribacter pedis]MBO1317956.1 HAMP domain-containing histidine kinase [Acanthopleuribacter pedis]
MAPVTPNQTPLIPEDWDQPLIFAWILRFRAAAVLALSGGLAAGFGLEIVARRSFWFAAAILACAAVSWIYGQLAQRAKVRPGPWSLFLQMGLDLGVFVSVVLLTGAHTNPFHAFYFLYAVLGAFWLTRARAAAYLLLWSSGLLLLGHHYLSPLSKPFVESWLLPRLVVGWVVFAGVFAVAHLVRRYRFHLERVHRRQSYAEHLQSLGALTAGVCHQLNSPLNTALLRLNRLKRGGLTENADLQALERALEQCRDALQGLQEKRLVADGLNQVPIDAATFLEDVFRGWSQARPDQKLTAAFQIGRHGALQFPALPVAEMIWDLLDNASEAVQGEGRIMLAAENENGAVTLSLRDNGPGFPQRVLQSLGKPFNSEKADGGGIGLYNAFLLMNALGGNMRLENPSDGGAKVSLVFTGA